MRNTGKAKREANVLKNVMMKELLTGRTRLV